MTTQLHHDRDASSEPILEIRDLSVTYQMDRGVSRVLDGVDFTVYEGELLGIVGESGSGKSMLASSLLDAVPEPGMTTGDVIYHSDESAPVDVLDLSEKQLRTFRWEEIAMVFQGAMASFNPTMKIRGHFTETFDAHDYPEDVGMERAHDLLRDLHLDPDRVLNAYPHELSGGMSQRALIALSLALEPEVLVMDEPTAALDLLMQRSIITLLKNIQHKYDITLLFITHDLPLITELADRLAVMYAFNIVEAGPAEAVLRQSAHPYTRALLNATPNLDVPLEEMRPIEGSSPDPVNIPSGCAYHPRCPLADEQCVQNDPHQHDVAPGHTAACFYWETAQEAIPLATDRERDES